MHPLRAIGYWVSDSNPTWPNPACFVDESQDDELKARVAIYLNSGECWVVSMGYSSCRLCGCQNGSVNLTDGYYEWPSGLAHYLEVHDVRLPDEFVQHVLAGRPPLPLPDYDEIRFDSAWWKSQTGWHDGSQVEAPLFRSYYESYGALWLTDIAPPVTAAQLRFVRRFADFSFVSTLALRDRLRSGEDLLLQHGFHASDVPTATAEAAALGLTLAHERYTSREEWHRYNR